MPEMDQPAQPLQWLTIERKRPARVPGKLVRHPLTRVAATGARRSRQMLEEKVMSVPADAGDGMEERREEMTQTTTRKAPRS
mmetsp:Transcript_39041/g.81238  ORF Transcript_39041/g.81238 Transcript_39041/m.81238 type:complete len:82 (-) Transcript_39041:40-285(-)